jgi:hypothetical protein
LTKVVVWQDGHGVGRIEFHDEEGVLMATQFNRTWGKNYGIANEYRLKPGQVFCGYLHKLAPRTQHLLEFTPLFRHF